MDCIILPVTAINHQSFLTLAEGTHPVAVRMSLGSQSGGGKSLRVNYSQLLSVETWGPACSVSSSWRHSWVLGEGLFQGPVVSQKKHMSKNTTAVLGKEALIRLFAYVLLWENYVKKCEKLHYWHVQDSFGHWSSFCLVNENTDGFVCLPTTFQCSVISTFLCFNCPKD